MKRLVVVFLLLSILLQAFNKVIIIIHWQLNQDYIAKNLCENRDKPMMHCCGKCLLKKKLAEENERQKLPSFPDNKNDLQYFGSSYSVLLGINTGEPIAIKSPYSDLILSGNSNGVFHPPSC